MPERLCTGGADQVEGDLHLGVASEVAFPADNRRSFQQVAGAVGRPGVADVVVAGKHQHAGGAQHLDRRHGQTAGAVRNQRDTRLGHRFRGLCRFPLGDAAEAEAVADRHLAAETERLGAGTDLLDIEEAHLARLVQVDVEPDPMPCRDREDAVELPFGVAVDLQRIDAADQIGAVADGRVEQVEDARAAHHAALREGHDLHRHPVAIALAGGKHTLQLGEAAFEIDVDMGA